MYLKFAAKADCQNASGKCVIRDSTVEHVIRKFQFRVDISITSAQFHRICPEVETRAQWRYTGNIYRQPPGDGRLSEKSAANGALRHIDSAEGCDPGLRGREALNQIRTPKAGDDDRLSRGQQTRHYGGFIVRKTDTALAIGHTYKDRR